LDFGFNKNSRQQVGSSWQLRNKLGTGKQKTKERRLAFCPWSVDRREESIEQ
jgi:hypothetical protein